MIIAAILAASVRGQAVPPSAAAHLNVGPLSIGESPAAVRQALGNAQLSDGGDKKILCYSDGESSVDLWFGAGVGLYRIEVDNGAPRPCTTPIPGRYRPVKSWRWAGGVVSLPPVAAKLREDGGAWIEPGTLDSFWHFRLGSCGGSIDYYRSAQMYSFDFGPFSCYR